MPLLFLIIAAALLELLLLFEVAARIGGLWTVALIVLTAIVGVRILKRQGLRTLSRARRRVEVGESPAGEIVEGALVAAAGGLLLAPGFMTDILGLVLLSPPLRRLAAARLARRGVWFMQLDRRAGFRFRSKRGRDSAGDVYEGEYSRQAPDSDRLDDSGRH